MSALKFPDIALKSCPICGKPGTWGRVGRSVFIECGDQSNCPGRAQTDVYEPEHAEMVARRWNERVDGHDDDELEEACQ